MEQPQKVERYSTKTWETPAMDTLRREHCMCLHCLKMKPGEPDHCPVAQKLYEVCKNNGMAFMVTRCKHWKEIL